MPSTVSTTHDRQAPTPQAMRRSSETSQATSVVRLFLRFYKYFLPYSFRFVLCVEDKVLSFLLRTSDSFFTKRLSQNISDQHTYRKSSNTNDHIRHGICHLSTSRRR